MDQNYNRIKVITNLKIDMPTFKVNPLTITPDLPTNSTIATKVTPLSNQSKLMPLMTVIPQTMNQTIVKMKGWDSHSENSDTESKN